MAYLRKMPHEFRNLNSRTQKILSRLVAGDKQHDIAREEKVSRNRVWELNQRLRAGYWPDILGGTPTPEPERARADAVTNDEASHPTYPRTS